MTNVDHTTRDASVNVGKLYKLRDGRSAPAAEENDEHRIDLRWR
jgi:hypothetical protein